MSLANAQIHEDYFFESQHLLIEIGHFFPLQGCVAGAVMATTTLAIIWLSLPVAEGLGINDYATRSKRTKHLAMVSQKEIDAILKWEIVFFLLWLGGIGSLIAIRKG